MISRKGRDDLVNDYSKALGLVNEAAHVLEDASVLISAVGESFARKSVGVIDHANDLYMEIQSIRHKLAEVKPDD